MSSRHGRIQIKHRAVWLQQACVMTCSHDNSDRSKPVDAFCPTAGRGWLWPDGAWQGAASGVCTADA